ncbi:MAG: ECF transporter S component, partial [Firmicutes bacterium]|nr:ECF transporter S component [Bacillota bacterium]
ILVGPLAGAILGFAFGMTSFFLGGSALVLYIISINPVLAFITCVVTRTLMGWLCGLIFKGLKKAKPNSFLPFVISALSAPVLNTILFMSTLLLCFFNPIVERYPELYTKAGSNVIVFVALFVGINALVEAVACTVVGSGISKAVYKNFKAE